MSQHLRKWNVLAVISDQHQAACMGVEGHPQAITPNMDRLAREGVRCSRAYTQNPICTPSRVSVFSGQYCHNHGYYGLSGPRPEHLPGFLGHFRQHGWRTAAIGKLHVPDDPVSWLSDQTDYLADSYRPERRDQDPDDTPYYNHLREHGLREKEDSVALPEFPGRQQHEGRPSMLPYEHSVEGWCVREAIRFIEGEVGGATGRPFCMHVSLPRPHQCYTPDRKFWDMYPEDIELPATFEQDPSGRPPHFRRVVDRYKNSTWHIEPKTFDAGSRRVWRGYLAAITQVDYALGELLDYLDAHGLAENTIVLYHADHGAYSGTFGIPEKAPGICSEAVCRIPMLWRAPGLTKPGHVVESFVENIDVAPTLTSICGIDSINTADGCDIAELLSGAATSVRDVAVTENPWSRALRWGPWRFVHYQPEMFKGDVGELYNLDDDPNETTNLYSDPEHQGTVNHCRRLLLEWLIRNTRTTTVWPPLGWPEIGYPTAADGKESNTAGPEARRDRGQIDYL